MNGQPHPSHVAGPSNGIPASSSGGGGIRVPTVHEALPYTPFTSIIHFSPAESIPPPLAIPTPSPSYFGDNPEVIKARETLAQLSAGASNAQEASERCQRTLRDVQKLLDPQHLTQFAFKRNVRPAHSQGQPPRQQQSSARPPQLSSFARMVLETNQVSYRYLTPESPEPQASSEADDRIHINGNGIPPTLNLPTPQSPGLPNGHAPPYTEQLLNGSQGSRLQAVVVRDLLTPAQRAEYRVIDESNTMSGARDATPSRVRDNVFINAHRSVSVDQKQKGDLAVQNLQNLLSAILDAEDQMPTGASDPVPAQISAVITTRETDDGLKIVLQHQTQRQLEASVQKVTSNARLDDIDVESLVRAQKLCETAVSEVETLSLQVGEEWSEQDVEEWLQRIALAERGITAARTLMRIMGAGAHVKELQSEDFLRAVLAAIRAVLEGCIVPVVEARPSKHEKIRGVKEEAPSNPTFITASMHQAHLKTLMHATTKTLRTLGDFLLSTELDESSLSGVESFCTLLIFTENASMDRDSVLGVQDFELTRRCAMDVLAKDFAKYTEQRQTILDSLLMSLDKLPAAKQSARQYKLPDSKPIQLVSALLMRLVQTSATHAGEATKGKTKAVEDDEDAGGEEDSDNEDDDTEIKVALNKKSHDGPGNLLAVVKPLHDAAQHNASYIVKILLQRALSSSKSSDEPYRKLLDIFTEDFLNVLSSSDWPCAEMMLRSLVSNLISMVEGPKSTSPARTLGLELLGTIATGILDLQRNAGNAARSLSLDESENAKHIAGLVEQLNSGDLEASSLVAFDGPYRSVVEYLQARGLDDAQLRSATGYHVMQWAFLLSGGREGSVDSDTGGTSKPSKDLQSSLRNMILNLHWLEDNHDYPTPSTSQGRLAAMVITLSSTLCKAFNRILSVLIMSMTHEQPKVKSRALKSVLTVLEKDPTILDRHEYVLQTIYRCANDASPLVRDSALMLIADCVKLQPELDMKVYSRVIDRTRDSSSGVRRRAMKFLKDLYLGKQSAKMRSAIADAIIARTNDTEEPIIDLARQIMEEIWFLPLLGCKLDGDEAVNAKLRYAAQALLMIRTVEVSEATASVLESLIKQLITKSKTPSAHLAVCKNFVRVLSDGMIDTSEIDGSLTQSSILCCLAVFARACPIVFTAAQLERLGPYTQNLAKQDDLDVYRSAIIILRYAMPHQSDLKPEFLKQLQTALMTSIPKLPKSELHVVVPCLWTIDIKLGSRDRMVTFVISAVRNIVVMRETDFAQQPQATTTKVSRLMLIVGHFGKVYDFEPNLTKFKESLPSLKFSSVTAMFVDVLCPLTEPKQPVDVRQPAIEAVAMICQTSPKLLLRQDVVQAFEIVFREHNALLEEALLIGLEGFFSAGEVNEKSDDVPELGSGIASGHERLGKTYVATDQDGASTSIARRFLPQILRLALSAEAELSLVASQIIISVNRQGLVHPKESGPALVALETCPNVAIADMAFTEHKAQHTKHESYFDKEYMRAVQQVFEYQRDVIGSMVGFIGQPPAAKMHLTWDVLKSGKAQVRKKFLTNLAWKLDFDAATLDPTHLAPTHLSFVRFCVENLAFFDYDRVEEILHLLEAMNKIFSVTGVAVAQLIDSEVLQLRVGPADSATANGDLAEASEVESTAALPDPARLFQLAVAAQTCSLIWTTRNFIRDLWNMKKHLNKPKSSAKESNKTPSRISNAVSLGEHYLKRIADIMAADATPDSQRAVCASFAELISTDNEVKVASEDEDNGDLEVGDDTPSESASRKSPSLPPSGGGRGRKRKSAGAGSTPRKKKRASSGRRKSGSAQLDEDEDGGWA
ncbi:Sister chromatid cohesion protein 2 [Elasticomyces elasticus]|nr:Sister chromatid cohesion protein 2 [Elasticomyces elasticus]